jgi:hypothetical protein
MSNTRQRYSIIPMKNKEGQVTYLFKDNDIIGGLGIACHYDAPSKSWTQTNDAIEAIAICQRLNDEQEAIRQKRAEEAQQALRDLHKRNEEKRNHILPMRTGGKTSWFPFW